MHKTISLAALLLLCFSMAAQPTFHKYFQNGLLLTVTPLSNGQVLGTGSQYQYFSPNQGLVARFDTDGSILWRKRIPSLNFVRSALELSDGFLILGDSTPQTGPLPRPQYGVVAKLNTAGQVIWARQIGGDDFLGTPSSKIIEVPGGYIFFVRGYYCIKVDHAGNTVWSKKYSTSNINYNARFSPQLVQGDTLYSVGHAMGNAFLLRSDINTGAIFGWSSFGGAFYEEITSLQPTQDGNFMMAGSSRTTTGSEEDRPWLVKTNRWGQMIWSKTFNIAGTNLVLHIANSDDGNYILSAGTGGFGLESPYAVLIKVDGAGNVLWAYNYAGGQDMTLSSVERMPDGGFLALGNASVLLKTDADGRVSNGCCPAPISFLIEPFSPSYQNLPLMAEDWGGATQGFPLYSVEDTLFSVLDVCTVPITSVIQQFQVCQGDSIEINGAFYQAPLTLRDTVQNLDGGCDTVRVYNLISLPLPLRVETISFCPGTVLTFQGNTYTQPDTIRQTLPATTGCDTLLVTFLQWQTLPKKYQTTIFCPGETLYFGGVGYSSPGIIPFPDTLPGPANGCDTLLYQWLEYPSEPSAVTVVCPPNIVVNTAPGTPLPVQYPFPSASSTCSCPEPNFFLQEGLPSGSLFPVGDTKVCYSAYDVCGDYKTCCFEVQVQEDDACDVKETSCIRYELLGIQTDTEQRRTYQLRVTNHCASPLTYTAVQIPDGVEALSPVQNSAYQSPSGNSYAVRNPSLSPFRSVRFKPLDLGIANGQSEVFEYTLPAQASPTFIRVATQLASGMLYEATLNTFDCAVGAVAQRTTDPVHSSTRLQVYPNPSSGEVFVDGSGKEALTLRLLSVEGRELAPAALRLGTDVSPFVLPENLPNGIYFLEIQLGNGEKQVTKLQVARFR